MKKRMLLLAGPGLCGALLLAGCIHVAQKAGQPARKATPLESAMVYNDTLAQTNKGIADAVINANSTLIIGNNTTTTLISADVANRILTQQGRIADLDRQLTVLLQDTANLKANSAQISNLLDQIKAAGDVILKSGDLGIKNPTKQQEIIAAFNQVYMLADNILIQLSQAGII